MDIGLFLFWWTQVAGTFSQRPIRETGIDSAFIWEAGIFCAALLVVVAAIMRLLKLRDEGPSPSPPLIAATV